MPIDDQQRVVEKNPRKTWVTFVFILFLCVVFGVVGAIVHLTAGKKNREPHSCEEASESACSDSENTSTEICVVQRVEKYVPELPELEEFQLHASSPSLVRTSVVIPLIVGEAGTGLTNQIDQPGKYKPVTSLIPDSSCGRSDILAVLPPSANWMSDFITWTQKNHRKTAAFGHGELVVILVNGGYVHSSFQPLKLVHEVLQGIICRRCTWYTEDNIRMYLHDQQRRRKDDGPLVWPFALPAEAEKPTTVVTTNLQEGSLPPIHQTWKSLQELSPGQLGCINKVRKLNPEWQHWFWSDDACRELIANNFDVRLLQLYDRLLPGAYKADLWRLCALYAFGGVYLDIDLDFFLPIREFFPEGCPDPMLCQDDATSVSDYYMYNAIMGSRSRKLPFLKKCLLQMVRTVRFCLRSGPSVHSNPLMATGPGSLGLAFMESDMSHQHHVLLQVTNKRAWGDADRFVCTSVGGENVCTTKYDGYKLENHGSSYHHQFHANRWFEKSHEGYSPLFILPDPLSPRTQTAASFSPRKLPPCPKIVHYVYFPWEKETGRLLEEAYQFESDEYFQQTVQANPSDLFELWTLERCKKWVQEEYPQFGTIWSKVTHPVQAVDFCRLLILYHFGGVNVQYGFPLLKPTNEFHPVGFQSVVLFLETTISNELAYQVADERIRCGKPEERDRIHFAVLSALPRNPFVKYCVDKSWKNICCLEVRSQYDILYIGGNAMLSEAFHEYSNRGGIVLHRDFTDFYQVTSQGSWRLHEYVNSLPDSEKSPPADVSDQTKK